MRDMGVARVGVTRVIASGAALALALAASGCDGSGGVVDAGPGAPDAGPVVVMPLFEPAVIEGEAAGAFFDFPYPSELRTDPEGHPDLTGFPQARGIIAEGIALVATEPPGFSPITGVYFRFTGPIDPSSLPSDPADAQQPDSPALLVDVDPDSPERGRLMPAYVRFQADRTRFWASNTLVVRAVPGQHLHPGRRYAVALRDSIRAADGSAVERAEAFEALKEGGGSGRLAESYAALFEELERHGVARGDLLAATAFTVSDPAPQMDLARELVEAQPLPEVGQWRAIAVGPDRLQVEAVFETYDLMEGEPPFLDLGSGRITFSPDGTPTVLRRQPVRVAISVPRSDPMPAGGVPVVLYGHGTGGDHLTHLRDEGPALGGVGLAVLGFEAALHGGRGTEGFDLETLIAANPVAAREMVRQTVVDQMLVMRMLAAGAFTVPGEITGGDPIPLSFELPMYMGHSQGSQEGGVLLAVDPTVQVAYLSAGGGGGLISMLERDLRPGQPLSCLVAGVLVEDCDTLTEDHPALTLIIQPLLDPADPLSFAHRFVHERPEGWAPLSLAMSEGTEDTSTPPRTVEALAASIGLPVVEPLVQASDPLRLLGTPRAAPPVRGNLTLPSGAVATGGLLQFEGQGHFAIYRLEAAERSYVEFFRTALDTGLPTIGAP